MLVGVGEGRHDVRRKVIFSKGKADMKAKGFIVGACLAIAVSMAAPANAIPPFNVPGTCLWDHPFGSVFDTHSGLDLEANGIAFNQALYSGYEELSENRSDAWLGADWDFVDGELFNQKARTEIGRGSCKERVCQYV